MNKVEGAEESCPNCGEILVCVLKKYEGYEPKLVWVNKGDNTTAHFTKFDAQAKKRVCPNPKLGEVDSSEKLDQIKDDNKNNTKPESGVDTQLLALMVKAKNVHNSCVDYIGKNMPGVKDNVEFIRHFERMVWDAMK